MTWLNMPKFLIILVLACPILWACACVFSELCQDEDFPQLEDEYWKDATCVDQEKYDSCVEYYQSVPRTFNTDIYTYCKEHSEKSGADCKKSSSPKK